MTLSLGVAWEGIAGSVDQSAPAFGEEGVRGQIGPDYPAYLKQNRHCLSELLNPSRDRAILGNIENCD